MEINEIFDSIYSFEEETKAYFHETVSDLKGEILLNKKEDGLSFKLGYPHFKTLYNKESDFVISHKSFDIRINHFLANYDNQNSFTRICNAYIFQSLNFDEIEKKYFSYYSRIQNYFLLNFFNEFKNPFSLKIDGYNFNISTCNINQKIKYNFLCIECESEIDFKKFKHYVNNLIVSIGFITGNFYKFEEFYVQSNQCDFKKDTDFFYRSSKKKYSFPYPFTKYPNEWNWRFKNNENLNKDLEKKYSTNIDEKILTNLVELLVEKPKIYFSIRMIFDFYQTPQISRVPLMFVVLETLCDELNLKSIFVEKKTKQEDGVRILNKIKDKITDDDLKILNDIVENIDNKLTNNVVHFEQTIKSLGIKLNNDERNILSKRNDFFHGRIIPKVYAINSEEDFDSLEFEYNHCSLRLFVLVSKILLKKSGFYGYLINYPKIFEDYNQKNINESYFIELK